MISLLPDDIYKGVSNIPVDVIREVFEHKVFNMLLREGAISDDVVENIRSWNHSWFHAWVGPLISCLEKKRLECLGQYQSRGLVAHDKLQIAPGTQETKGELIYDEADDVENSKVTLIGEKVIKRHSWNKRVLDPLSFSNTRSCDFQTQPPCLNLQ